VWGMTSMKFRQWIQDRRCFNCGSTKLAVRGDLTPLAKVRCGDCDVPLITLRNAKKVARDISIQQIR
jgi:hypothetical protein